MINEPEVKGSIIETAYWCGWADCLDVILDILSDVEGVDCVRDKVEGVQVLVKAKKSEIIRVELGVIGKQPF